MAIIQMNGVSRYYAGGKVGVRDMTAAVNEGEVYGLIGRNGSGKTTTMRLIMGMMKPSEGTLSVFGEDPWKNGESVRAKIGYLAEGQLLPSHARVGELMAFFASLYPKWDKSLAGSLMRKFSLDMGDRVGKLSAGQQRQVGLICAVSHRPPLLVLDEPAGGLDAVVRRDFLQAVIELLKSEGTTVFISSHLLGELERIVSRVCILKDNRPYLERDMDALREEFCVALIDPSIQGGVTALRDMPGCIRASSENGQYRVVFMASPQKVDQLLHDRFNTHVLQFQTGNLEDIFLELLGEDMETP